MSRRELTEAPVSRPAGTFAAHNSARDGLALCFIANTLDHLPQQRSVSDLDRETQSLLNSTKPTQPHSNLAPHNQVNTDVLVLCMTMISNRCSPTYPAGVRHTRIPPHQFENHTARSSFPCQSLRMFVEAKQFLLCVVLDDFRHRRTQQMTKANDNKGTQLSFCWLPSTHKRITLRRGATAPGCTWRKNAKMKEIFMFLR